MSQPVWEVPELRGTRFTTEPLGEARVTFHTLFFKGEIVEKPVADEPMKVLTELKLRNNILSTGFHHNNRWPFGQKGGL